MGRRSWMGVVFVVCVGCGGPPTESRPSWSERVSRGLASGEYQLRDLGAGRLGLTNRAQDLRAIAGPDGVWVEPRRTGGWGFRVWTASIGRGDALAPVQAGAAERGACVGTARDERGACIRRVERPLGQGVTAWWTNDPSGLRQGWIVPHAPPGEGPLGIVVGFEGVVPEAVDGGVRLVGAGGSVRYDGLAAWDAEGRALRSRWVVGEASVRLEVDVDGARWPVTVDPLVSAPSWAADGAQEDAAYGSSVAGAGDVDGDGFDDVLVGAPAYDAGQPDEGRVFLYRGGPLGVSDTAAWTAESGQAGAAFGNAVDGAGDVDGDGFDDVLIGSWLFDAGRPNEGRAFVFLGGPGGPADTPVWTAESNQSGGQLGASVAGVGDVDGDGFDDVAVGGDLFAAGQLGEGRVWLHRGGPLGPSAAPSWTGESNQESAEYGSAVAGAGDVNGDGFDDVIVGAPAYDGGQMDEGRVYVYLGGPAGLGTSPWATRESNQARARFGEAVSGGGDLDGDGLSDLIVGAPNAAAGQALEGRVWVYPGGTVSPGSPTVLERNQAGAGFGSSVAVVGDVDGDGFDDMAVGAPHHDGLGQDDGAYFLFLGGPAGVQAAPATSRSGGQDHGHLGGSVAGAGDVDGDGFDDVIVGGRGMDGVADVGAGVAFLFLADPPAIARTGGPYAGVEGLPVALDGSSSQGSIWRWDCEDDGHVDGTGPTFACVYADQGVYTVRLQVEDPSGDLDEGTTTVTVANAPPVVHAGSDASGAVGVPVGFVGSAHDVPADPLSLRVDCGAGAGFQPVATASFACTYTSDGVYTVTLEADDGDGGVGSDTATATVVPAPGGCTPADWLCAAMPDLVEHANVAWGAPVVAASAQAVRLRPATLQGHLQALVDGLEARGCLVSGASLQTAGGAYDRGAGALWGAWSGGPVTGSLGPGRRLAGSLAGGEAFGGTFGQYNGVEQAVADRADGGFLAGRYARVAGQRGVWLVLHGTCEAGVAPATALDPWYVGGLSGW